MAIRKLSNGSLELGVTAFGSFLDTVGMREVLPWSSLTNVKVWASELMNKEQADSILAGVQYHSETYSPFASFFRAVGLAMTGCWRGVGEDPGLSL